ncbi:ADP-ribosylglycohydrolase family protein [Brachyspira aalborgi]|uniref:ADP-ribosylglycohydrolase family protein n=1 Tax=Brachyspira aalborgi TaxID=29522 RepID=A0A5C8GH11_9SPIR|nr:ADP-ribosylglycohydrolase family protein [Brachyspira aalborgi]TXJ61261.1 ADP-ribosylglycohydrolase family protein [Brachyspira aalborgi]
MLGAIIGDIVGSIYEFDNIKTKNFNLFTNEMFFTDDTVMTIAIADAIMNGGQHENFIQSMKKWGCNYIDKSYGHSFRRWLKLDIAEPYNSWGNGSAMRVSPCSWIAKLSEPFEEGLKLTEDLAKKSAEVTHNHPEGIKGAQATASSIFFMRYGKSKNAVEEYKNKLKDYIQNKYKYDLNFTLNEIRPSYAFNESCQKTVPQAIVSFLESENFEDAIRNAISIGGDSDTLAAITGSIAEAAYGIPEDIKEKAINYLDNKIKELYNKWANFINLKN